MTGQFIEATDTAFALAGDDVVDPGKILHGFGQGAFQIGSAHQGHQFRPLFFEQSQNCQGGVVLLEGGAASHHLGVLGQDFRAHFFQIARE